MPKIMEIIEQVITENNPGAPKDVLEEKLEDINEIEKAEEELKDAIQNIKTAQKYGVSTPDYDDPPETIIEWYKKCIL